MDEDSLRKGETYACLLDDGIAPCEYRGEHKSKAARPGGGDGVSGAGMLIGEDTEFVVKILDGTNRTEKLDKAKWVLWPWSEHSDIRNATAWLAVGLEPKFTWMGSEAYWEIEQPQMESLAYRAGWSVSELESALGLPPARRRFWASIPFWRLSKRDLLTVAERLKKLRLTD